MLPLLYATCPAVRTGKSTAAVHVDSAASATLTANTERDYSRLRDKIATVTKQLEGAKQ
ncbi:lysis system i-spanin subunit Rz [Salmonella sp. SKLX107313]|uniref:lysis system i-spanin subunit Rz n=1 Tax=Salmonella sp. SKLX107313 TaxID=3160038 RepID=UPI00375400A8